MTKYWRLLTAFYRSIPRTYLVWRMNEATAAGKEVWSCASCGMANVEPCEHWQNMIDDRAQEGQMTKKELGGRDE